MFYTIVYSLICPNQLGVRVLKHYFNVHEYSFCSHYNNLIIMHGVENVNSTNLSQILVLSVLEANKCLKLCGMNV